MKYKGKVPFGAIIAKEKCIEEIEED